MKCPNRQTKGCESNDGTICEFCRQPMATCGKHSARCEDEDGICTVCENESMDALYEATRSAQDDMGWSDEGVDGGPLVEEGDPMVAERWPGIDKFSKERKQR